MLTAHCGDDASPNPVPTGTTSSSSSSSSSSSGAGGAGGEGGSSTTSTGGAGGAAGLPDLDPTLDWYGDNRQRLDAMIDEHGANSPGYDPDAKPVAVFDWDNTVIKNDIGDATVFWMLQNDAILQPPGKNWALVSPYLTADAMTVLSGVCDALAEPGQPLPTSTAAPCADEILSLYYDGMTTWAMPGWTSHNYRRLEPGYAFAAQLTAGHTPDEIRAMAEQAAAENLAAPEGATQTVGTRVGLTGYIRIYDQIRDLISTTQQNGFDVWVVSASPQYVVEPVAAMVGVAADHVIGIRQIEAPDGTLTSNLAGCGPVPDGTNDGAGNFTGNSMITYIDGKRCWINKVIYGDAGPTALDKNPDPSMRPVFSAGDADTDVTFTQDATAMKLVLNRNKKEIMCNAYGNHGGIWLINPMFIAPKGQLASGYACSTTACKDEAGASVPCLDEAGNIIPDQADNVY